MSDSTSDNRKKIPTLTGKHNYDDWARKVKAFLITQKVWKAVDPSIPVPTAAAAHTKWQERDELAYGELFLLVSDEIQGSLEGLDESSQAVWGLLASKYAPKNTSSSRQTLRTTFYGLSHDPTLPVDNFIMEVKRTATKLKKIGHPYDDDEISDKILMSLDTLFMPIRTVLCNETPQRDLDGICDAILNWEESELKRKESPLATYVAHSVMYGRGSGGKGRQFDWGNKRGRTNVCTRCGLPGHSAPTCIHDMPESVKRCILSQNQNRSAHIAQDIESLTDNFANVAIDATDSASTADREALYALALEYGEPIQFPQHTSPSSSPIHPTDTTEYSMVTVGLDDQSPATATSSHNFSPTFHVNPKGDNEAPKSYWDRIAQESDSDTSSIDSDDFSN